MLLKFRKFVPPSKIDQWCKPKPAAKLVLALVRRSPLMLKERVRGSMNRTIHLTHHDATWHQHSNPAIPLE